MADGGIFAEASVQICRASKYNTAELLTTIFPMKLFPRGISKMVIEALEDTRVVAIVGARQVGKSTLAEVIAAQRGFRSKINFDSQPEREGARSDPAAFIAELETPALIDEVQRVPETLLEIKRRVDRDQRPGQFLLTGSANILTAPTISDALTGRAEYHRLWPLTQGERLSAPETFLDGLINGELPRLAEQPIGRTSYAPLIAAGGFPASLGRQEKRRNAFFTGYIDTVIDRDLSSIATIGDRFDISRLLRAFAAISGAQLNFNSLANDLNINFRTAQRHLELLETLFLVRRLPSYSSNLLARVTKTPKGYISDTGLLLNLLGANDGRIRSDDAIAGLAFETFAANELLRQTEWQDSRLSAFHYRDRDQREVDLVLEHADGRLIAIEIKAAASAVASDFKGLRYLRDRIGNRFVAGCLLYTGASTVPFGDRLSAVPLSALWGGFKG